MRFIDSHCHLHLMDLSPFEGNMSSVIQAAKAQGVEHFLCVSVELEQHDHLVQIATEYAPDISISVGVHPTHVTGAEPTVDALVQLARHPCCVAIGETGLDYFRISDPAALQLQQDRFVRHIHAAKHSKRPLIIHTRQAPDDTLSLLKRENALEVGGVFHCFTESFAVAKAALDLGFYISFSGIITFKNAVELQEVAKKIPLNQILIETDSPYLAPAPYRGQQNHPAWVVRVAEVLAELKQVPVEEVAEVTMQNFYHCFPLAKKL